MLRTSDVCHTFNLNKKFGTAYVGNKIVLLCCRVVSLHVFVNGWYVVLALDVDAQ